MKKAVSIFVSLCLLLGVMTAAPFSVFFAESPEVATGGVTGDCLWTLVGTELTISGSGAMEDYNWDAPWGNKITKVVIEEGVTYIGKYSFFMCESLESLTIPSTVTRIGENAAYYCHELKSLTIPENVVSIGEYAFSGCKSLESVRIPASVTSINYNSFSSCSGLKSLVIDPDNPVYDSRNNCNGIIETATDTLICGFCITEIPDSVVKIGDFAYNVCSGLTEVVIPDSVVEIGENAFYTCSDLSSVKFGKGLRIIGKGAFSQCSSLDNVVLPEGLTEINSSVFNYCYSLKNITIPDSVTVIRGSAFANCRDLTSIVIPAGVASIEVAAFYYCNNLTSVVIPSEVKSIGDSAFGYYYNNGVQKVDDLVIYGYINTEAQRYAAENGFEFKNPSQAPDGLEVSHTDYYLTGTCNGWDHSDAAYLFTAHDSDDGADEYKLTVNLKVGDEFKIISANGTWYPDGMNNNRKVTEDGVYSVYFRPNYDGHSDWFNKVIYMSKKAELPSETEAPVTEAPVTEAPQPTEAPATEPATVPASEPSTEAVPDDKYFLGDADSDGDISILDATAIQRVLAAFTVNPFDEKAADSDEDGELSILDATAIQRFLVGLQTHQGIGKAIIR